MALGPMEYSGGYKTFAITPESNAVTINNSYAWQNGSIVYVSVDASINTAISSGANNYAFASNLPKPKNNEIAYGFYGQLNVSDTTRNRFASCGRVDQNGKLTQQWGSSLAAGLRVSFLIIYVTDE